MRTRSCGSSTSEPAAAPADPTSCGVLSGLAPDPERRVLSAFGAKHNSLYVWSIEGAPHLVFLPRKLTEPDDLVGPGRSLAVLSGRSHQGSCPFPCEVCTVHQLTTPC